MKNMHKLGQAVATVREKVARLEREARKRQASVASKIDHLRKIATSSETPTDVKLALRKDLRVLEAKLSGEVVPTLEEVEKEVDRIYGDQSLNSTYYFNRRQLKNAAFLREGGNVEVQWTNLPLEEVNKIVDDIYGDQSKNETFYFSRRESRFLEVIAAAKAGQVSLEQVMQEMNSLYGDQSKNETFYPSRRLEDGQRLDMVSIADEAPEANWQTDEQYYLMDSEFDKDAGGYFKQDDFINHNQVVPTYRVDNTVDTYGYWGDEADEAPHVVQNRTASLNARDKDVVQAFAAHKKARGHSLSTDGVSLVNRSGDVVAEWARGKVELHDDRNSEATRLLLTLLPSRKILR